MARYQRIFAALDGATTQLAVARRAIDLAADHRASLLFGHVIDSVPADVNGANFEALCAEGLKCLEEDLAEVFSQARNSEAISAVEVQVRAGRVAETLVEHLAEPFAPDLVICGERGLSSLKYAFVGSVSTYLIRHIRCDVLVVKQN